MRMMNDSVIRKYEHMTVNDLIDLLKQIIDSEKNISVVFDRGEEKLCGRIDNLGWVNIIGQSEGEYVLIVKEARNGN